MLLSNHAPRFSLDILRESNLRANIHCIKVTILVVIDRGTTPSRPVTVDTAIRIDKFIPAGVHHIFPTRLITSGRTHFPGSCPTSGDQNVAAPPRLNKEVSPPV